MPSLVQCSVVLFEEARQPSRVKRATPMLPLPLKFSFEKFRRELSPSARSDLDRLALSLNLLKGPKVIGETT